MNERIRKLAKQCYETGPIGKDGWPEYSKFNEGKFAKLIVQECVNVMLNTDEQKFVVETEGWELGGANHGAWDRGILDAVETLKEHWGLKNERI